MNNFIKKTTLLFAMILLSANSFAQDNTVEMATGLYQSGKIYVVVIVMALIFVGIIGYLILLDRKITKLEKDIQNK